MSDNTQNEFGKFIQFHRLSKGLSLGELSKLSGISIGSISEHERGLRKTPKITTLEQLSKALDIPLEELISKHLGIELEKKNEVKK